MSNSLKTNEITVPHTQYGIFLNKIETFELYNDDKNQKIHIDLIYPLVSKTDQFKAVAYRESKDYIKSSSFESVAKTPEEALNSCIAEVTKDWDQSIIDTHLFDPTGHSDKKEQVLSE